MNAEALLNELEAVDVGPSYGNREGLGTLLLAVEAINREITEGATMGDEDRLRKLVDRLHGAARKVAEASRAHGFSISGGIPAGVGVSVEWVLREDEGRVQRRIQ
jgi:hypothetical protein